MFQTTHQNDFPIQPSIIIHYGIPQPPLITRGYPFCWAEPAVTHPASYIRRGYSACTKHSRTKLTRQAPIIISESYPRRIN